MDEGKSVPAVDNIQTGYQTAGLRWEQRVGMIAA